MRLKRVLLLMIAVTLSLASCAAQFPFIAPAAQSEAADLQALCQQQSITAIEKMTGDSLAARGAVLLGKGKREAAYRLFERAGICYRIALTKNAVAATEKQIAAEESALEKTREDVSAYKQVLKELKTMEQQ